MEESEKNASKIRQVKELRDDLVNFTQHVTAGYNSPETNMAVSKLKEAKHWLNEYLAVLGDED